MTPQIKLIQTKGRVLRNPCNEIFLGTIFMPGLGRPRFGSVNKKLPLNKRVWKNARGVKIPLGKMNRGHCQAALQFCHQRRNFKGTKDGYTFPEWVAMFFAKVMDPNTLE